MFIFTVGQSGTIPARLRSDVQLASKEEDGPSVQVHTPILYTKTENELHNWHFARFESEEDVEGKISPPAYKSWERCKPTVGVIILAVLCCHRNAEKHTCFSGLIEWVNLEMARGRENAALVVWVGHYVIAGETVFEATKIILSCLVCSAQTEFESFKITVNPMHAARPFCTQWLQKE